MSSVQSIGDHRVVAALVLNSADRPTGAKRYVSIGARVRVRAFSIEKDGRTERVWLDGYTVYDLRGQLVLVARDGIGFLVNPADIAIAN